MQTVHIDVSCLNLLSYRTVQNHRKLSANRELPGSLKQMQEQEIDVPYDLWYKAAAKSVLKQVKNNIPPGANAE